MTLIPGLTFTELRVVSVEHLLRVWLTSLPFRTPGSAPLLGICLCSNCWDQVYRIYFHKFSPWIPLSTFSILLQTAKWNSCKSKWNGSSFIFHFTALESHKQSNGGDMALVALGSAVGGSFVTLVIATAVYHVCKRSVYIVVQLHLVT